MPRPPRLHWPSIVHHVIGHGNAKEHIFLDSRDRVEFLEAVREARLRMRCEVFAYCLMSNHFHILVRSDAASISRVMHYALTRYVRYFNRRNDRKGHLFQSRFKALACDNDVYLLELLRYIHLNPVRAGLVQTPELWPWSGHSEMLRPAVDSIIDSGFPLSLFGPDLAQARAAYRDFLGDPRALDAPDPFDAQVSCDPIARASDPTAREQRDLSEIAREVQEESGIPTETLTGMARTSPISSARHAFIRRAVRRGFRPSDVARFLSCSPAAVSKVLRTS